MGVSTQPLLSGMDGQFLTEIVDEMAFAMFRDEHEGPLKDVMKLWLLQPLEQRMAWRRKGYALLRAAGFVREDGNVHTVPASGEA